MRLSTSRYSTGCHDGPNWDFVRRQLGVARTTWLAGETPPLPLLASELAQLQQHLDATDQLPVPVAGRGRQTYESLRKDLERGKQRAGTELVALTSPAVNGLEEALASSNPPDRAEWLAILRAGSEMADVLAQPNALVAAFDDVMACAAELDADHRLASFGDRLDTFRAVAEQQGWEWAAVEHGITRYLTARDPDPERDISGGHFLAGMALAVVLDSCRRYLGAPVVRREYAVWVATLAGPRGAEDSQPTVIGNGIAVCGVAGGGDVATWLGAVRTALTDAYRERGQEVPRDVTELGAPWYVAGEVLSDGIDLWRSVMTPSSFVSRVVVTAASRQEAHTQAHAALRAVFARSDRWISQDIRPDSWFWTQERGWDSSGSTARDLALGEVSAARTAGNAVASWTADFVSPLRPDDVRLMQARSLVNDRSAPAELRLTRGVASLEAFYRHANVYSALDRLWLRWTWHTLRRDLDHLLWDIALGLSVDAPSTEEGWVTLRHRRDAFQARVQAGRYWYDTELFDAICAMLRPLDENTASRAWIRNFERRLDDSHELRRARFAHREAVRRAQRHRNLVVHGWHISDEVVGTSADFIALQLELAVVARADAERSDGTSILVGFARHPDEAWMGRTPRDLLDGVAALGRHREANT
jgi:hypothetical protein